MDVPAQRHRRARRTSSSCWSTTWATATSARSAPRSHTPNLDRLAARRRSADELSTPRRSARRRGRRCSPGSTRTGRVGFVAERRSRLPGLRLRVGRRRVDTAGDPARQRLCDDCGGQVAPGAGRQHAPRPGHGTRGRSQRGFDRYYGSLEGLTSFLHPQPLISDNPVVDVDSLPRGLLPHRRSHRPRRRMI